jgi:hypothetical protein
VTAADVDARGLAELAREASSQAGLDIQTVTLDVTDRAAYDALALELKGGDPKGAAWPSRYSFTYVKIGEHWLIVENSRSISRQAEHVT